MPNHRLETKLLWQKSFDGIGDQESCRFPGSYEGEAVYPELVHIHCHCLSPPNMLSKAGFPAAGGGFHSLAPMKIAPRSGRQIQRRALPDTTSSERVHEGPQRGAKKSSGHDTR